MFGEDGDSVVEEAAELADFFGVEGDGFLFPAVGDGFEEGDEGGGGGEDDFVVGAELDEGGVLFEGGAEEDFSGEEEDDEFWGGVELFPVVFGAEFLKVVFDLAGVVFEFEDLVLGVLGVEGVEVGAEGGFGIDDDFFVIGEIDDHVGALAAFFGGSGLLFQEVDLVDHAGEFDGAAKLHFAPLSADVWCAEGFDEVSGFGFEFGLAGEEVFDLFVEAGVGAFAGFFEGVDLFVEFL